MRGGGSQLSRLDPGSKSWWRKPPGTMNSRGGLTTHYRYPGTMIGAPQLLIVLLIVLVLFGGAKLPDLARSLGQAQREFKKGTDEDADDASRTSSDQA